MVMGTVVIQMVLNCWTKEISGPENEWAQIIIIIISSQVRKDNGPNNTD